MKRMGRMWLLPMMLFPSTSLALQLHWSSGADTLSFASATRCVLILRADPTEAVLPGEWRLAWVADSAGVNVVAMDSLESCIADTAKASAIDPPATPADSAANQVTAHFCSTGEAAATVAYFILDQPGGSQGRLKVVALDPTDPDSSRVIESNEVTYNGGVDESYGPTILRATSTHETRELRVTVVGSGLASANSLRVTAPDRLWSVPLGIIGRSDSTLTAAADVPMPLPAAVVEAGSSADMLSLASFPADQITVAPAMLPDTVLFVDPDSNYFPKDFAFYYTTVPTSDPSHPWKGLFHLIYTRQHRPSGIATSFGHAWSENLRNWRVSTVAFSPNAGWDGRFVWAPSIVQVGNLHYMFYTGVDLDFNQRIGYATTGLLDTTNTVWSATRTLAYQASNTGWADSTGQGAGGAQQFRDPWVMPDPDSTGRFLLFNVGEDKNYGADLRMVVGVARNAPGTLSAWRDLGSYRATDYGHTGVTSVESPLVARDSSGTGAWRIYFANAWWTQADNVTYLSTSEPGTAVWDTTAGKWPDLNNLYDYMGGNSNAIYWQATEHLQVGKVHLFAAWNGTGIGITRMYWNGSDFVIGYPDLTGVGDATDGNGVRFYAADLNPGAQSIRFVVESPSRITPRIVVYDVTGRKLRTLAEGQEIEGRREVLWDRRDARGASVPTGIYFARLTGTGAARVLRVPLLR